MRLSTLGTALVLLFVTGCGQSGMRLDSNFEERAHALPIVVDQAPPRTTPLAFGSTQVENLTFTSDTSLLSFDLEYARERFTSRCESTSKFDLVCNITSSAGSEFTLRMQN